MDKRKLAIALISLLITTSIGPSFFSLARANPLPDIEPVIKIGNPQNTTFNVNNIVVNFTASSWWDAFPIFYNLDGSDKIAVNNTKVVSEESGYWSLPVKRVTVEGSIALSGVSEGWHNLTLYMVTNKDFSLFKDYI